MANAHDLLMAQRAAMMGGKLPYLRRLEYIQSHGTEYIKTGIVRSPKAGLGFIYDGTIDTRAVAGIGFFVPGGLHFVYDGGIRTGGTAGIHIIPIQIGERITIETFYNSNTERIAKVGDDISHGTFYNCPSAELRIFGMISISNVVGKCYGFYVYEDGDFIAKFIPVLDFSGRPCLYDQVQSAIPVDDPSRFHYNDGTGTFDYWPND